MNAATVDVDRFLNLVSAAQELDTKLTAIQAGILVAARVQIASDSRSFARALGIEHAIVLRELNQLLERGGCFGSQRGTSKQHAFTTCCQRRSTDSDRPH